MLEAWVASVLRMLGSMRDAPEDSPETPDPKAKEAPMVEAVKIADARVVQTDAKDAGDGEARAHRAQGRTREARREMRAAAEKASRKQASLFDFSFPETEKLLGLDPTLDPDLDPTTPGLEPFSELDELEAEALKTMLPAEPVQKPAPAAELLGFAAAAVL
mmetsp:Transcript_4384/g.13800  ORF Transcript_4384/g.13800 Transcript_4384/m.13800 type:complete len:161 (+) Transcript_4384:58-540(+)